MEAGQREKLPSIAKGRRSSPDFFEGWGGGKGRRRVASINSGRDLKRGGEKGEKEGHPEGCLVGGGGGENGLSCTCKWKGVGRGGDPFRPGSEGFGKREENSNLCLGGGDFELSVNTHDVGEKKGRGKTSRGDFKLWCLQKGGGGRGGGIQHLQNTEGGEDFTDSIVGRRWRRRKRGSTFNSNIGSGGGGGRRDFRSLPDQTPERGGNLSSKSFL